MRSSGTQQQPLRQGLVELAVIQYSRMIRIVVEITTYIDDLQVIWDRNGFISNPFADNDAARLGITTPIHVTA